jgi:hypothetical protein
MSDDPTIRWTQPNRFGIQIGEETAETWHSGHVTDVFQWPDLSGIIVATETGGVWAVDINDNDINDNALPLSDGWDTPDVKCLAVGPDGSRHVFAGCTHVYGGPPKASSPVIMETNVAAAVPLLDWQPYH